MAEPFGIVAGAVGIAAAFSTCIEVFKYVRISRRFGKDFESCQLRITLAQLQLSRWGEAVHVYDDPRLGKPDASEAELQAAKNTLLKILELFEDSQKTSEKYSMTRDEASGYMPALERAEDATQSRLLRRITDLSMKRQKGASLKKLSSWAIHDHDTFKSLVTQTEGFVMQLHQLFPPSPTVETHLARLEASVAEGREEVQLLMNTAKGIDEVLHRAAAQVVFHRFQNVDITAGEDGAVLNGNIYSSDYTGGVGSGASHLYDGVKITGTKGLKVLNGDKYGGSDFFSRS